MDQQRRRSVWTAERVALLLRLARAGLRAREIGRQLGASKNAVIGRLHRERRRGNSVPRPEAAPQKIAVPRHRCRGDNMSKAQHKQSRPPVPIKVRHVGAQVMRLPARWQARDRQPAHPVHEEPAHLGRIKSIDDLEMCHCRWIHGDPREDHSYCGAPVVPGLSWCAAHARRVTAPIDAAPSLIERAIDRCPAWDDGLRAVRELVDGDANI